MPEQHVILITHTTLHLSRVLLGFAFQTRPAESVTVSCDTDRADIAQVVESASRELRMPITLVQRTHTGKARCAQVRNNAVRALLASDRAPGTNARLIFLDGDTVPAPDMVELHERLSTPRQMISTFRINLSEAQTAGFDEQAVRELRRGVSITPEQSDELAQRHARYRRQLTLSRLRLTKRHKPRMIGGHFSVPLSAYLAVNGTDEAYEGYGQEDDDLTRRMRAWGAPTLVAVRDILAFHLWHPTRAPQDWHTAPGVARFNARHPVRALLGIDQPAAQPTPVVRRFGN